MNERRNEGLKLLESSEKNLTQSMSVLKTKSNPPKIIKSNTYPVVNNLTKGTKSSLIKFRPSNVQTKNIVKRFILPKNFPRGEQLVIKQKISGSNNPVVVINPCTPLPNFCRIVEQNRNVTTTNTSNTLKKNGNSNSLSQEETRNTVSHEKSPSSNQTIDEIKIANSNSNDISVIDLESDMDCIEHLDHETGRFVSNSNPGVSKHPTVVEKTKLLGMATRDSEGKLIYTDLRSLNNNNTTVTNNTTATIKKPRIETSKTIFPTKNKEITLIFPAENGMKSHLKTTDLNISLLKPVSEMLNSELVALRPDQALNLKPVALNLHKPQVHTVETQTINLQDQIKQTERPVPRLQYQSIFYPVEQTRSDITSLPLISATRLPEKRVHKSVWNGSPPSKVIMPLVRYFPQPIITSVKMKNKICRNLKTITDKNNSPLKQILHEKTVPQSTKCVTDTTEPDTVNIHSNNQSEVNQIITPISDKANIEYNEEINYLNDCSNINRNFIGGNTQVMWNTNKDNLAEEGLEKIVLSALEDFKVCRNSEDEDGNIPLLKAVLDNNKNTLIRQCIILKTLGQEHLNYQNKRLDTALLLAVKSKNDDFVATLLSHGADQSIADRHGNTALHISASLGSLVCTKLLLAQDKARDISNTYNDEGFSPIHLAAMGGHSGIVRALICEGADINKKDAKSGRTAYHHATHLKKQEVVKVLEGLGCLTNEQDFAGHLPLYEELIIEGQAHTKNKRNENQIHSPRKRKNVVLPDDIDKNGTIIVPKKKRQIQNRKNSNNEILTLSSEDSCDDDCMVVDTKYRNKSTRFIPSKKRRRRKLMRFNDDSDCEVIDNPIRSLNSHTSNEPVVNTNNELSHNSDIALENSNIRSTMPVLHSYNSDRSLAPSPDNTAPLDSSKDNNGYESDSESSAGHTINLQSDSDEEMFKGFTSDDDLSDLQLNEIEQAIRKFINDSQVF